MPSGPGPIPETLISQLVQHVPEGVASFLLTSKQDAVSIVGQVHRTHVTAVQLVDTVGKDILTALREEFSHLSIAQVIHITGEEAIRKAIEIEQFVDCLLLDSGNPDLRVKELGGTGRTHDWKISKTIVDSVTIPVYLAGGLKPENVRESIETVHPFGVDVCSGVRTEGKLDEEKLKRFFEAIKNAGFHPNQSHMT